MYVCCLQVIILHGRKKVESYDNYGDQGAPGESVEGPHLGIGVMGIYRAPSLGIEVRVHKRKANIWAIQ